MADKYVILDVNGVGYKVYVPERIKDSVSKIGDSVKLYTHTLINLNDGSFDIYGFSNPDDLHVFLMLVSVSGIGPSLAHGVVSMFDAQTVQAAILNEDYEFLGRIPRIGRKTARRMVLELQSKVKALPGLGGSFKADVDAADALTALGYSRFQAQKALNSVPREIATSEGKIKEALKILGRNKK